MKVLQYNLKDIYSGYLILVNQEHSYREQHQSLTCVGMWEKTKILYECTAAAQLEKLMREIKATDQIVPVSAWRSMEEQKQIWDDSLAENGLSFTRQYVAVPGHSEHQTGLAIDLAWKQSKIDFIRPYFPYKGICQIFRERAAAYGFVERYQKKKQAVTQIGHEPWHFRYVGVPHAAIMTQMEMALEEYITFVKTYHHRDNPYQIETTTGVKYAVSFVEAAVDTATEIVIDDTQKYNISGNNWDGFIVTQSCCVP